MKATNLTNPNANQMNRSAFSMMELVFVIVIIGIMAAVSVWYLPRTELKQAAETMMTNLKYTKTLAQLDERQFIMGDEKYFSNTSNLTQAQREVAMQNQIKDWQKGMWQFQFHSSNTTTGSGNTYTIYAQQASSSNTNFDGKPGNNDIIAKDPMTKECISGYGGTNLRGCDDKYAKEARFYDTFQTQIDSIASDDCLGWSNKNSFAIFFDSKGMPYCRVGNNTANPKALTKSITIKLKRKNENAYICITKGGIIESGLPVDKNGQPQKDKSGRTKGIPIQAERCKDI